MGSEPEILTIWSFLRRGLAAEAASPRAPTHPRLHRWPVCEGFVPLGWWALPSQVSLLRLPIVRTTLTNSPNSRNSSLETKSSECSEATVDVAPRSKEPWLRGGRGFQDGVWQLRGDGDPGRIPARPPLHTSGPDAGCSCPRTRCAGRTEPAARAGVPSPAGAEAPAADPVCPETPGDGWGKQSLGTESPASGSHGSVSPSGTPGSSHGPVSTEAGTAFLRLAVKRALLRTDLQTQQRRSRPRRAARSLPLRAKAALRAEGRAPPGGPCTSRSGPRPITAGSRAPPHKPGRGQSGCGRGASKGEAVLHKCSGLRPPVVCWCNRAPSGTWAPQAGRQARPSWATGTSGVRPWGPDCSACFFEENISELERQTPGTDFGNAALLQNERSHTICCRGRLVTAVALGDLALVPQERKATRSCSCWTPGSASPGLVRGSMLFW